MEKRNDRKLFSLVSANRVEENPSNRLKVSDINKYGKMDIDYLMEDLSSKGDFPKLDTTKIIRKFGPEFIRAVPRGYTLSKKLGQGVFGSTFSICKSRFECSALKVIQLQDGRSELQHEINMQNKFHSKGLAPAILGKPIYYKYKGKQYGVIHMEQIDGVLDNILSKNLIPQSLDDIISGFLYLVGKMDAAKYAHRDAHPGNIAVNYKRDADGKLTMQLSLIDFGHSKTNIGAWPELEVLQFLRCLSIRDKGEPGVTQRNQDYIWERLIKFEQTNFDKNITTIDQVEDMFNKLFDKTMDM